VPKKRGKTHIHIPSVEGSLGYPPDLVDGERVTTGSEPRRWTIYVCPECGFTSAGSGRCPMHSMTNTTETERFEVQEVVGPGHDEQTDAALDRLDAHIERANAVWEHDPRTVAAVVEELDRAGAYIPSGRTFEAGRYIENHPRFKPSASDDT
jgi:hypothetical protein